MHATRRCWFLAAAPGLLLTLSACDMPTNGTGILYAMMTTRASAPHGPAPGRFFEISQAEVEASLGASPWAMQDLGDKAVLYQTRRPDHSELWLLQ